MSYSTFNPQLDKVTEKELNLILRERIALSYNHIENANVHVSTTDRNYWNSKWDKDNAPLATKYNNGLMSKEDKIKLDTMGDGSNYVHPTSGVSEGSYLVTIVDKYGHVTYGSNPEEINTTATNAKRLGGVEASKYALKTSPAFLGVPTCPTAPSGDISYQIANTQFVNENTIPKIFEVGTTPPNDKRMLWIDTSQGSILKYWGGSSWLQTTTVFKGEIIATSIYAESGQITRLATDIVSATGSST